MERDDHELEARHALRYHSLNGTDTQDIPRTGIELRFHRP